MKQVVRKAIPSDKEPLMSFIKKVWGGHDYIPYVWDAWLKEKNGMMFVVVVDGRTVGMSRIRFLGDGAAWLEGARIHPEFRGRGLATALGERCIQVATRRGITTIRLTSSSRNHQAHRQIARIGFKEVARFSVYVPSDNMQLGPQKGVVRMRMGDYQDLFTMVLNSPEYQLGAGVMWDAFAAIGLTRHVFRESLSEGQVYSTEDAIAIAKVGGEGGEDWSQVCFLAGGGDGAVRLIRHLLGKNKNKKIAWRLAYIPQGSALIGELRRVGMKRDISHILFERRLPNS